MIPDVPRSLRDQLKKENMMLIEFLLNQDQEAHAKSHGPKRPNPCFPAHIDIVVEAPEREQEEVGAEGVESIPGGLRRSSDSDPEFGRSLPEKEESTQEEPGGKGEDEAGGGGEKETQLEDNEEDVEGLKKQQEADDETEDKYQRREEEAAENCSVDLDALMSEMGLLGEKGDLNARLQLFLQFIFTTSLHPLVYYPLYILLYLHLFCTTYCNSFM